eukprot:TRINITY_DN46150_c0_g1_i1.p1 TRINITY_DN46150_c0_g1~~TRINITY_DN46150_c0_g1_i1.p1  ORF type:complete len:568 (-),score=94.08 TRINITY_DN46150_c0_g1_i1:87-1790(-)
MSPMNRACSKAAFSFILLGFVFVRQCIAGLYKNSNGVIRHDPANDVPLVAPAWARRDRSEETHSITNRIRNALGIEHAAQLPARVLALQETLRPLFSALPKNAHGRLEHATARYALHRHFVREFSAHLKGLEPLGNAWNASSPVGSLKERVPSHVSQDLHTHVEMFGFDLKELAMLGASLEMFILQDSVAWLRNAYKLLGYSADDQLDHERFNLVLDVYLWVFLGSQRIRSDESLNATVHRMAKVFPDWNAFRSLLTELSAPFLETRSVDFASATRVVDGFMRGLGKLQLNLCNAITDTLAQKDSSGSGRVKVSEFYMNNMLSERPDVLREIGAVDPDSDGYFFSDPRIIISNYVSSAANCVTATKHMAMCCPDACDSILSSLETRLARPVASPEQILKLVEALPSRTIAAPRKLSDFLTARLRDIAENHRGKVPLHSRLFAQWLHHAFPYECVFPMPPSKGSATSAIDWHRARKASLFFSSEEAAEFMQNRIKDLEGGDLQQTLPWLTEEKMFIYSPSPSLGEELGILARCLAFCGSVFALAHLLLLRLAGASGARGKGFSVQPCI